MRTKRIHILPPGLVTDPRKLGREDAALDHQLAKTLGEELPELDVAIDRLVSAGLIGNTQRDEYKRGYRSYSQERAQ